MDFFEKIIEDLRNEYEGNENIRAMIITGSVAKGEAIEGNDLDVLFITSGDRISKEYRVENSLIEIGSVVLPQDLERIDQNPMYVYMWQDAKAIFDKDNSLSILKKKAEEVLSNYKPTEENRKALIKWLSSVVDKVETASKKQDFENVGFHISNVLWKIVEGIYMINDVPTPASTSALRRIKTLKVLPEDFNEIWVKTLLGDLKERTESTLKLLKFTLEKLEDN